MRQGGWPTFGSARWAPDLGAAKLRSSASRAARPRAPSPGRLAGGADQGDLPDEVVGDPVADVRLGQRLQPVVGLGLLVVLVPTAARDGYATSRPASRRRRSRPSRDRPVVGRSRRAGHLAEHRPPAQVRGEPGVGGHPVEGAPARRRRACRAARRRPLFRRLDRARHTAQDDAPSASTADRLRWEIPLTTGNSHARLVTTTDHAVRWSRLTWARCSCRRVCRRRDPSRLRPARWEPAIRSVAWRPAPRLQMRPR